MKNGTAISGKLSMPEKVSFSSTISGYLSARISVVTVARPSANATGTPMARNTQAERMSRRLAPSVASLRVTRCVGVEVGVGGEHAQQHVAPDDEQQVDDQQHAADGMAL